MNFNLPRRVLVLGDSEDKQVPMLSTCLFLFSGSHLSLYLPMDGPSHLFLFLTSKPTLDFLGWIRKEEELPTSSQADQSTP